VDGSAAVLIGSKEFGETFGLKPRAKIRATAKIGLDPTIMLTGPVPVTEHIMKQSGMSISDIDLFEVNEAFASVVLRFMQAFNVDADKVNVNGGSIAMGHPLGATGAIIIGTLLDELERSDKEVGMATLCVRLEPGALSSLRHWHVQQDEFLVVTDGVCTLIDDHGETLLHTGDCAAFPAGDANGHTLQNQSDAPAAFVVVGTRTATETGYYSDEDMMVTLTDGKMSFTKKDGGPLDP